MDETTVVAVEGDTLRDIGFDTDEEAQAAFTFPGLFFSLEELRGAEKLYMYSPIIGHASRDNPFFDGQKKKPDRIKLQDWIAKLEWDLETFQAYYKRSRAKAIAEGTPEDQWPLKLSEGEWQEAFLAYLEEQ